MTGIYACTHVHICAWSEAQAGKEIEFDLDGSRACFETELTPHVLQRSRGCKMWMWVCKGGGGRYPLEREKIGSPGWWTTSCMNEQSVSVTAYMILSSLSVCLTKFTKINHKVCVWVNERLTTNDSIQSSLRLCSHSHWTIPSMPTFELKIDTVLFWSKLFSASLNSIQTSFTKCQDDLVSIYVNVTDDWS